MDHHVDYEMLHQRLHRGPYAELAKQHYGGACQDDNPQTTTVAEREELH